MDNSKEFFDELYNSEFTQIEKYVRRMLYDSNAVEDIVQETFFEVYRKREELMKHPNIKGWCDGQKQGDEMGRKAKKVQPGF